jgi:hypothetical protein
MFRRDCPYDACPGGPNGGGPVSRSALRFLGALSGACCLAMSTAASAAAQVSGEPLPLSPAYTTLSYGTSVPMGAGLTIGRLYPRGEFGRIMSRVELAGGVLLDKGRESADFYGGPLLFLGYAFGQSFFSLVPEQALDPYFGLTTGVNAVHGGAVGVAGVAAGVRAVPRHSAQGERDCQARTIRTVELQLQYWTGHRIPLLQGRLGYGFPGGC